jgi:hypothetical protein
MASPPAEPSIYSGKCTVNLDVFNLDDLDRAVTTSNIVNIDSICTRPATIARYRTVADGIPAKLANYLSGCNHANQIDFNVQLTEPTAFALIRNQLPTLAAFASVALLAYIECTTLFPSGYLTAPVNFISVTEYRERCLLPALKHVEEGLSTVLSLVLLICLV